MMNAASHPNAVCLTRSRASVPTGNASEQALQRMRTCLGEPLLMADWRRALFIHFEVDPAALAREVPFEPDLWEGRAFVSLVAFTLHGIRLRWGGALGRWLLRPIATHRFLNLRAYVRHRGEPGIHFLAEWLDNPLAVKLGPRLFGLPYRRGRLDYRHEPEKCVMRGSVESWPDRARLSYEAVLPDGIEFRPCAQGSLDEFLLERYTAFTHRRGAKGFFRVWHRPWPQCRAQVRIDDDSLLRQAWPWMKGARLLGTNYSPGAFDVWMGRPHRLPGRGT